MITCDAGQVIIAQVEPLQGLLLAHASEVLEVIVGNINPAQVAVVGWGFWFG